MEDRQKNGQDYRLEVHENKKLLNLLLFSMEQQMMEEEIDGFGQIAKCVAFQKRNPARNSCRKKEKDVPI